LARAISGAPPQPPALYTPGSRLVLEPDATILPGVHGPATFTVNEFGLRGRSWPHVDNVYKIMAIGGSTTECLYLDDSAEWPHLLMEEMNARQKKHVVWVANAGVSGHTSVHSLALLQSLPILSNVDMLIFLIGANDLQ